MAPVQHPRMLLDEGTPQVTSSLLVCGYTLRMLAGLSKASQAEAVRGSGEYKWDTCLVKNN